MPATEQTAAQSDPLLAEIETAEVSNPTVLIEFEVANPDPDSIYAKDSGLRSATVKEQRYLERLEFHGNRKLAVKEAGFPAFTPPGKIEKAIAQTDLGTRLTQAGITDEFLALKVKEGLDAEKNFRSGIDTYVKEPDWTNRHRFLETTLNLKGYATNTQVVQHTLHGGFDMSGLLLGAFRIMARSSGIEIDEDKLRHEIGLLAAPTEPLAPMEALDAQIMGSAETED